MANVQSPNYPLTAIRSEESNYASEHGVFEFLIEGYISSENPMAPHEFCFPPNVEFTASGYEVSELEAIYAIYKKPLEKLLIFNSPNMYNRMQDSLV